METSISTCLKCGTPQHPGASFCGACGQPVAASAAHAVPQTPPMAMGQGMATQPQTQGGFNGQVLLSIGLAVAGLFICGPFTSVPGAFIAWNEQKRLKSVGGDSSASSIALMLNGGVTVISLLGCMLMGLMGMVMN